MEKNLILDLNTVPTKLDLLLWIKYKFEFPDYFGLNWDAVDECLRDFVPKTDTINIQFTGRLLPDMDIEIQRLQNAAKSYNKAGLGKIVFVNDPY